MLIGLALLLTFFVMQPVIEQAYATGLLPMSEGRVTEMEGLVLSSDIAGIKPPAAGEAPGWRALVPAFLVSELRHAFEMGFLPFLVIDMVIASALMSLGMMMLPPSAVSLPFKLIFFVMVDGWRLAAGSLVQSFGEPR